MTSEAVQQLLSFINDSCKQGTGLRQALQSEPCLSISVPQSTFSPVNVRINPPPEVPASRNSLWLDSPRNLKKDRSCTNMHSGSTGFAPQPATHLRSLSTNVKRQASPPPVYSSTLRATSVTRFATGTPFESPRCGSSPVRIASLTRDPLRCGLPCKLSGDMAPRTPTSAAFTASRNNSVSRLTLGCPRDASPLFSRFSPRKMESVRTKQSEIRRQESVPSQMNVNDIVKLRNQLRDEVMQCEMVEHRQQVQRFSDRLCRGGSRRASF